jgi:hypothetical protein
VTAKAEKPCAKIWAEKTADAPVKIANAFLVSDLQANCQY